MPPKKNTSAKVIGYCVKCKLKREMNDAKEVILDNGRKMMKGVCTVCGTKMGLFIK